MGGSRSRNRIQKLVARKTKVGRGSTNIQVAAREKYPDLNFAQIIDELKLIGYQTSFLNKVFSGSKCVPATQAENISLFLGKKTSRMFMYPPSGK